MGDKLEFPIDLVAFDRQTNEAISIEPMKANETYQIVKKSKLITPKQQRWFNERDNLRFFNNENGGFIFMLCNNEILFNELDLDLATISRIINLATYIDYNTNVLVVGGGANSGIAKTPMTKKDIQKVLNLTDSTFKRFYKDIKDNNLIIEEDNKFIISKKYFVKGENTFNDKEYTRIYIDTIRNLYKSCKTSQHKTLAYVFRLIPKLHYDTNTICFNPNDKEPNHMNLKQIGEFLGVDTEKKNLNKFKNNLYKIYVEKDDIKYYLFKRVILEGAEGREDYFVVNPMVIYGGNKYEIAKDTISKLFFNK